MTARPAIRYALACHNRKGWWINAAFIGRTRREVREAYLAAYIPEYRAEAAKKIRAGAVRILRVQVSEVTE